MLASGRTSTQVGGRCRRSPAPACAPRGRHSLRSVQSIDEETLKDMSGLLTLDNIRSSLIRQEDTIIFNLIERAQYAANDPVYVDGAIAVPGYSADGRHYSLLEYSLRETEQLHGKVRRYTSPDEHAFFPGSLPSLVMKPIEYDRVLASFSKDININARIMEVYINEVVPEVAQPGDDNNYGSSSMLDVAVLQALSKRIHYGMFVAEAKFREEPAQYTELIKARDSDGIMALLTDIVVEDRVVERVTLKAATFGQDITNPGATGPSKPKVKASVVGTLYRKWIMPLTKDVEVAYLLRRLEDE
ncbi:hypothetical protein FOA52_000366 [Chlamydomonas sp. UWO 241]|nr:hypothetical protein FOA52_000366 [Chlamydomonas sp. UWO 241]